MSPGARPNRGGAFEKWTVRLLLTALLLALPLSVLIALADHPLVDWRAWFDGPERGTWRALTLNGEPVFEDKFLVTIAAGAVVAGRDGCNDWSFSGVDERTGEPIYTSTVAGCVETPAMVVYGLLARGEAEIAVPREDRLVLTSGGCRGVFRRWTRGNEDAERARYEAEMAVQREMEERRARSQPAPAPAAPATDEPPPPMPPPPPLPAMPEPASSGC